MNKVYQLVDNEAGRVKSGSTDKIAVQLGGSDVYVTGYPYLEIPVDAWTKEQIVELNYTFVFIGYM